MGTNKGEGRDLDPDERVDPDEPENAPTKAAYPRDWSRCRFCESIFPLGSEHDCC